MILILKLLGNWSFMICWIYIDFWKSLCLLHIHITLPALNALQNLKMAPDSPSKASILYSNTIVLEDGSISTEITMMPMLTQTNLLLSQKKSKVNIILTPKILLEVKKMSSKKNLEVPKDTNQKKKYMISITKKSQRVWSSWKAILQDNPSELTSEIYHMPVKDSQSSTISMLKYQES